MTISRFRRTTTVAALAATALGGGALAASAVSATSTAHTQHSQAAASSHHYRRLGSALTIHVRRHSIPVGASDHIAGRLTHQHRGLRGRHVILQSRAPKTTTWTVVADHVTGAHGRVGYTVSPASTTRYRLVFAGGELLRPARSAGRTVQVGATAKASSLSIRGKQVASGENISGVLRGGGHALRDRRVTLQSQASGSATWTPVRTRRTGRHGLVRFDVATPTVTTSYELVFAGGARYDGSTSGIVTVTES